MRGRGSSRTRPGSAQATPRSPRRSVASIARTLGVEPTWLAHTVAGVEGDSMIEAGIQPGDDDVVDRSVEPKDGDVVVAALNGELTVKQLRVRGRNGHRRVWLVAANDLYPPIEVCEGHELMTWGVITHVIHRFRK